MNILIVCPNLNFGGAEKVAVNLANEFSKNNSVTVVLLKSDGPLSEFLSDKVVVKCLHAKSTLNATLRLKKQIALTKPNVLISVLTETNFACGLVSYMNFFKPKYKSLYRVANTIDQIEEKGNFRSLVYKLLIKLLYTKRATIVFNSQSTKEGYLKRGLLTGSVNRVIYNPVFNSDYSYEERVGTPIILGVGRLVTQKNFDFFIEVAHQVINIKKYSYKFIIVGEGALKSKLQEKIDNLGLEGSVEIHKTTTNIESYYKKSSLFFLTSIYEGFGNVVVEAMNFGLPCLVPNCPGGPTEIVTESTGIVYRSYDKERVSTLLIEQIELGKQRNIKYYEDIMERAKDFSPERIAREYLDEADVK